MSLKAQPALEPRMKIRRISALTNRRENCQGRILRTVNQGGTAGYAVIRSLVTYDVWQGPDGFFVSDKYPPPAPKGKEFYYGK